MVKTSGQVSLSIADLRYKDRNFDKGGRSFYFFDFDDNVVHLNTKIILFHKKTGDEFAVSTTEFALIAKQLGKANTEWQDFEVREDPPTEGSFRNFRELPYLEERDIPQPLIIDMLQALSHPFVDWRGPSWPFFVHAVNNNRPLAVITARGHHPHTIKRAINMLVVSRDLDMSPNYLSVYPVSHDETRRQLEEGKIRLSVAELKKKAIRQAVKDAFACYGKNPAHRFGMSDDDPHNLALIREAMFELKREYPENAFFVISTHNRILSKEEIILGPNEAREEFGTPINNEINQLDLFGELNVANK